MGADGRRTVIAVFTHPAYRNPAITGLSKIQPGVRKDIQIQPAGCPDLDDFRAPGSAFADRYPAQGYQLAGMTDVSFSDQILRMNPSFFQVSDE